MKPLKHMLYSIGNTPTVQINEFVKHLNGSVGLFAKLEGYNPTGCSTDRAAFGLIKDATKAGMITESTTIVDAVLGNMGPSIAYIARMLGHRCIITAPDTISAYNKRAADTHRSSLRHQGRRQKSRGNMELYHGVLYAAPIFQRLCA